MDDQMAKRLREPFPPEHVGLLPRVSCRDCSKASGKVCDRHEKRKCDQCGNYMTTAHIHLDYVGHAAITDRLLEVDPSWNWDPIVETPAGSPGFEEDASGNPVGLWIQLTVGDVTRRGYGSCPPNQSDAEKVLIGDALRNSAMRFGVALDLWIKGHVEDVDQSADHQPTRRRSADAEADPLAVEEAPELVATVKTLDDAHRAAFGELWLADDRLPTEGDPPRPRMGLLRRSQVPIVHAILTSVSQSVRGPVDSQPPAAEPAASELPAVDEISVVEQITQSVGGMKVADVKTSLADDFGLPTEGKTADLRAQLIAALTAQWREENQ